MSIHDKPVEADWIKDLRTEAALGRELVAILSHHCGERGDSESAVETLNRIIRERGSAPSTGRSA
jgi:hypothetical protein